jgi:CheY-like chemotaxis protein
MCSVGFEMKVLVVDDSSILRDRLVGMLSEIPFVEAFGQSVDEQGVLEILPRLKPEAMIFDAQMSGGKGLAALARIRQSGHVPIIFIFTNDANEKYKEKCLKAGADYFFDKSKELREMMLKFTELARQQGARDI